MSDTAEKIALGAVDRAPYEIPYLFRRLPEHFSSHSPLAEADRPVAEATAHHASNASDTLIHGLAAIGHVLMQAGLNAEGRVSGNHLARLGDLITHMAIEVEFLHDLEFRLNGALGAGRQAGVNSAASTNSCGGAA
ncbi:hypothetical protein CR152_11435 [Massilia violaceinigra]|uniref:Uncharacterized protein n=1 Tax=Massilia violaceinigra TaxID=2045208 RepID=A0A2D2DJB2_9BURK|nr:hypothetical protein [Massilia violaceinigra]ATQ75064.1 hypothetical protein CR152_11435 [Massilia violaceinigra]